MNPIILLPVMGKLLGRLYSLTSVWQLVYEIENTEFQPGVDLERDGFCLTILARDTLLE